MPLDQDRVQKLQVGASAVSCERGGGVGSAFAAVRGVGANHVTATEHGCFLRA